MKHVILQQKSVTVSSCSPFPKGASHCVIGNMSRSRKGKSAGFFSFVQNISVHCRGHGRVGACHAPWIRCLVRRAHPLARTVATIFFRDKTKPSMRQPFWAHSSSNFSRSDCVRSPEHDDTPSIERQISAELTLVKGISASRTGSRAPAPSVFNETRRMTLPTTARRVEES